MSRYHSFFCCNFFKSLPIFPHHLFLIIIPISVIIHDNIAEDAKGRNTQANILAGLLGLGVRAIISHLVVKFFFKSPTEPPILRNLCMQTKCRYPSIHSTAFCPKESYLTSYRQAICSAIKIHIGFRIDSHTIESAAAIPAETLANFHPSTSNFL